jgi:hypothetical protein
MKIELKEITVAELTEGYKDSQENGVVAFGGLLDVRPPYQREFVYKNEQCNAVIETILHNYPLNVMYWACRENNTFEIIDGQQRTISICQYVKGAFSYNNRYFHNLQKDEKELILNYKMMIYFCEGTDSEKLKWFETINIAGEKLTKQELRNAVYSGSFVSDAKRYFSKNGCVASKIASDYLSGSANRQEYLETAIKWISQDRIEEYMSKNQHKPNANELWTYFQNVINWINLTFINYRKEMKGVDFGLLYNKFKNEEYDGKAIESKIANLMLDDDVTNKKGIYSYILTNDKKHLNIRAFTDQQKRQVYEKQDGICIKCQDKFDLKQMEADHITPWSEGGKTDLENCQMLCTNCNRRKSDK